MQLAQAAKEKMHPPDFSLAVSAPAALITKSEGTNPIQPPDGQHVFFKTNPTAILYRGLHFAISNTATRFTDPLHDFHGQRAALFVYPANPLKVFLCL
jgi:hypothetical protein